MISSRVAVTAAGLLFATALTTQALGPQAPAPQAPASPQAPAAVPPPAAGERGQAPPAQGRGGGRGNPMATLYTERCAGCHGTDMSGGRAPSLFDDVWVHGADDESIARTIENGVPNTEMMAFKGQLTEPQIWQMVAYLKTQGANLKAKPVYVPDPDGQVITSEKQKFKVEVVARELETPWGLAFLPDGRLLITERPGRLRIWAKGALLPAPVTGTPTVWERQDAGLFDVEVHPQYASNGWIYLAYSEPGPNNTAPPSAAAAAAAGLLGRGGAPGGAPGAGGRGAGAPAGAAPAAGAPAPTGAPAPAGGAPAPAGGAPAPAGAPTGTRPDPTPTAAAAAAPPAAAANTSNTVIVRGKINAKNEWVEQQVLFRSKPELYTASNAHFGARFIFDREGHLFFSIGERGEMKNAQDLSNPLGKIHRVNDDGTIPKDNPFVNRPDVFPSIWSYGHRNPQGLAWEPGTGKLWESEHGPQGGDEINIIEKGKNYGWGVITMGVQPGITKRAEPGMEPPIVYYTPTIAPSGIVFYTGNRYPAWKNNLFVSALGGQQLRRLEVTADKVTHQEVVFNQFGRIHDVVLGPDGYLYVTMQLPGRSLPESTPGMVARLIPQ
jgi:glucose/arabinose dehydrogenase